MHDNAKTEFNQRRKMIRLERQEKRTFLKTHTVMVADYKLQNDSDSTSSDAKIVVTYKGMSLESKTTRVTYPLYENY